MGAFLCEVLGSYAVCCWNGRKASGRPLGKVLGSYGAHGWGGRKGVGEVLVEGFGGMSWKAMTFIVGRVEGRLGKARIAPTLYFIWKLCIIRIFRAFTR